MLGDHGFRGKEERHYDACIRVPLIIAGPGLEAGSERDEMVQLEDICPTVLEMMGQSLPPMPMTGPYLKLAREEVPTLPRRSLLPLCRGKDPDTSRDAAYCESYNAIWSNDPGDWARTIRTKSFRYTLYPRGGDQLFDLHNDLGEQCNLVTDPAYARVRQELRDELLERIILQDYPKTRRELFALGVH
jgi:arylsulfatase A-like enzyme